MTRRAAILGIFSAFAGLALAAPAPADDGLPKAETILDHFIEVTGGKAAYAKRKTEVTTGTVEVSAQGLKGTLTRYAAEPDKSYTEMDLDGVGKIEQGTGGGVAWEKNAMTGPRVKSGEEKAQAMREAIFNGELNWREMYPKAETAGIETIDGEECYKVVLTPAEGKPETTYYQKKSGLAVKTVTVATTPMGEFPVEQLVSDYKDFGGVLMPTKLVQKVAGQEMTMTIQTVKVNQEIPDNRFDPPAEIKALLQKK